MNRNVAKKAKTSTLSTEQNPFVCLFKPSPHKIDMCVYKNKSIVVDYRRNFDLYVMRIESFIWLFFTVKGFVYRFRFLQSIRSS